MRQKRSSGAFERVMASVCVIMSVHNTVGRSSRLSLRITMQN